MGGEFTLLDLDSRVYFKEDPRFDPQHSAELLIRGFQLRIEYMNTNIVILRINQAEMYLNDEWKLREASHLSASASGDVKDPGALTVPTSREFSMTSPAQEENEEIIAENIGTPPVYVMIAGEINWDQLQVRSHNCYKHSEINFPWLVLLENSSVHFRPQLLVPRLSI